MRRSAAVFAIALACTVATSASAQNIVTNPGFETGDLSGWTLHGNTGFIGVTTIGVGGSNGAFFGPVGSSGGIFQSLATTPGQTYTFSWWVTFDGGTTSLFDAWWDGGSIFAVSNPGSTPGFVQQSFGVVATGASTDIRFFFRDDPGFEYLDDVSVVASGDNLAVTPEPATMTLLATGLVGMAGAARRRRKASAK